MTSTYEFTGRFSSLTTDPNARAALSPGTAYKKALSNFVYITRDSAVGSGGCIIYRTHSETRFSFDDGAVKDLRALTRERLKSRVGKHREKRGIRLLDKGIVSLPEDANTYQQWEMAASIVEELAGDSEALVIAAIHTDSPGNPHLHLFCVDGLETLADAEARAQSRGHDKKRRVRQADYLRLGDLDGRKNARLRCAEVIDRIALREGLKRPETRSYKARGIEQMPQIHEGPHVSAQLRQKKRPTARGLAAARYNIASALRQLDPPPRRLAPMGDVHDEDIAIEIMADALSVLHKRLRKTRTR